MLWVAACTRLEPNHCINGLVGLTAGSAIAARAEGALMAVGEGAIVRCTRFLLQRRSANAIA